MSIFKKAATLGKVLSCVRPIGFSFIGGTFENGPKGRSFIWRAILAIAGGKACFGGVLA